MTKRDAARLRELLDAERRTVSEYDTAIRAQASLTDQQSLAPGWHPSTKWDAYRAAQAATDAHVRVLTGAGR